MPPPLHTFFITFSLIYEHSYLISKIKIATKPQFFYLRKNDKDFLKGIVLVKLCNKTVSVAFCNSNLLQFVDYNLEEINNHLIHNSNILFEQDEYTKINSLLASDIQKVNFSLAILKKNHEKVTLYFDTESLINFENFSIMLFLVSTNSYNEKNKINNIEERLNRIMQFTNIEIT